MRIHYEAAAWINKLWIRAHAVSARKLLLRGAGRVGARRGAGSGCEGVCHPEAVSGGRTQESAGGSGRPGEILGPSETRHRELGRAGDDAQLIQRIPGRDREGDRPLPGFGGPAGPGDDATSAILGGQRFPPAAALGFENQLLGGDALEIGHPPEEKLLQRTARDSSRPYPVLVTCIMVRWRLITGWRLLRPGVVARSPEKPRYSGSDQKFGYALSADLKAS